MPLMDLDHTYCDRFWAKALHQEATRTLQQYWAMVG